MRKIEIEMLGAIAYQAKAWQKDNTRTEYTGGGCVAVYLHGNHIANVMNGYVYPNVETWEAWPTVTTESRLRALGVNCKADRGAGRFIDSEPVPLRAI